MAGLSRTFSLPLFEGTVRTKAGGTLANSRFNKLHAYEQVAVGIMEQTVFDPACLGVHSLRAGDA